MRVSSTALFSVARLTVVAALMFGSVAIIYLPQLVNGFAVLGGDRFDAVISASILEHWHRVFLWRAEWSEVGYFYPTTLTIAHTDAYFLVSIPYSLFRFAGVDPLLAQEFVGIALRCFGFATAYLLCKRTLAMTSTSSVFVAMFFVVAATTSMFAHRPQLSAVMLTPLLLILAVRFVRSSRMQDARGFVLSGSGGAALFSLLCLTSFYIAWFSLFFGLVFFALSLLIENRVTVSFLRGMLSLWKQLILVLLVGIIAGIPFLYAFGLKSLEVGARSWESISKNLVQIEDLIFMHPGSVGGGLIHVIPSALGDFSASPGEYSRLGFSVISIVFLLGAVFATKAASGGQKLSRLFAASVMACALAVTDWNGLSVWRIVFELVPGAAALNVASAIFIMLTLPVGLVIGLVMNEARVSGVPSAALIMAMLVLEASHPWVNLDRREQLALLSVPEPPSTCNSFYVGPLAEQHNLEESSQWIKGVYPHNVAALYIAQQVGIPTINGFASFQPKGWDLAFPARADYEARVMAYVRKHRLEGVCRLDIEEKRWTKAAFAQTE